VPRDTITCCSIERMFWPKFALRGGVGECVDAVEEAAAAAGDEAKEGAQEAELSGCAPIRDMVDEEAIGGSPKEAAAAAGDEAKEGAQEAKLSGCAPIGDMVDEDAIGGVQDGAGNGARRPGLTRRCSFPERELEALVWDSRVGPRPCPESMDFIMGLLMGVSWRRPVCGKPRMPAVKSLPWWVPGLKACGTSTRRRLLGGMLCPRMRGPCRTPARACSGDVLWVAWLSSFVARFEARRIFNS
jgi:hypothetical protein